MELRGHLLYYPEGKHDINLNNYVQKSQLNDAIKSKVDSITKTTYADLKNLRDNSQLVPGNLYRITDYQCTTTQENTQSAGHQFDIVLLALSKDKLAEEGWAMMNESNVYDVTFKDGVTKKCWLYEYEDYGELVCNIVDYETLLGTDGVVLNEEITIDKENKTATFLGFSYNLPTPDLPYNYFQNSNLSAWKVWYSLDNDTDRFAWADDTNNKSIIVNNRYEHPAYYVDSVIVKGVGTFYAWADDEENQYLTANETPVINEQVFTYNNGQRIELGNVTAYIENPNGHGVIYRLIDEWNIDYPCDFKNMLTLVPMDSDDNIDIQNPDPFKFKYCYAFTDNASGDPEDLSINGHAINIKVKANLIENTHSAMYFSPTTLFYTNNNEGNTCRFSNITVGIANVTIFINRGYSITILDGSSNVILKSCSTIYIGYNSGNIVFNTVVRSTFGSNCQNIQLTGKNDLNYGNNGVELATKDDIGDIETALSNI